MHVRRQVHSLVLASSGALLLCCVDRSSQLADLRQRMRATFPGIFIGPRTVVLFNPPRSRKEVGKSTNAAFLAGLSRVLKGFLVRDCSQTCKGHPCAARLSALSRVLLREFSVGGT